MWYSLKRFLEKNPQTYPSLGGFLKYISPILWLCLPLQVSEECQKESWYGEVLQMAFRDLDYIRGKSSMWQG